MQRNLAIFVALCATGFPPASANPGLVLVPEMERPAQIIYQRRARRQALNSQKEARMALELLARVIAQNWPEIQKIDYETLSRFHVEMTKGWKPPEEPVISNAQVVGRDDGTGKLFLEAYGPRLPARYEIVYRYLVFYSSYDPVTHQLGPLVVTIRGRVLE